MTFVLSTRLVVDLFRCFQSSFSQLFSVSYILHQETLFIPISCTCTLFHDILSSLSALNASPMIYLLNDPMLPILPPLPFTRFPSVLLCLFLPCL